MKFEFENLDNGGYYERAKVHGGWLVRCRTQVDSTYTRGSSTGWKINVTFVPDPNHDWQIQNY